MKESVLPLCLACGSPDTSHVATWGDWVDACSRRDDGPMRLEAAQACGTAAGAPELRKCGPCQSVFMNPVPTGEQIGQFYANYHATDDFVSKAPKKVKRAYKRLLPFRLRALFSGSGRMLDVGASVGTAAEAGRKLGYSVTAQEIDADAVTRGRAMYPNVTFIEGFLTDVPVDDGYDLIHAAEVIEHVPDPAAFAAQLFERLRPGGQIFLTTPDVGHSKRPANLMDWKSVKPPEHITLFTKAGLTKLFVDADFETPKFRPHTKPGIRMKASRPN